MVKKLLGVREEANKIQLETVKQIIVLATNGLGLVAALAWNNVIQETVNLYIKPYLPNGSGLASLFIYAFLITILAVSVTTQLARVKERLERQNQTPTHEP